MADSKIKTRKELWPVVAEYEKLAQDPATTVQKLGECSKRISEFLEMYTAKLASASATATRKASFLQKFDSKLTAQGPIPAQKFYSEYGSTHVAALLKISYYKDLYIGQEAEPIDYKDPNALSQLAALPIERRVNRIIDSIVAQIFQASSNKELFLSLCDWMIEEARSTLKVIRMAEIFSRILGGITKKRAKFLQGFLYVFGGVVKAETYSYIKTMSELNHDTSFQAVEAYIDEKEKRFIRTLDKAEIETFEKHMPQAIARFFASLSAPASMRHAFTSQNEDYLYNITRQEYVDNYDDDHKKRSDYINPIEAAHYTFMFGFDTLAFYYTFLYRTLPEQKALATADRAKLSQLIASGQPLTKHESVQGNFGLAGSEDLIQRIVQTLLEIAPDPIAFLRLWRMRLVASGPQPAMAEKKRKEAEDPTYDRTSQYNGVGAGLFFYILHSKGLRNSALFPLIVTKEYMFELYVPVIRSLLEFPATAQFGVDLLQKFLADLPSGEIATASHTSGYLDTVAGLAFALVQSAGGQANESVRYFAYLMTPLLLKRFSMAVRLGIYERLFARLDADGARAFAIDTLRGDIMGVKSKEELRAEDAAKVKAIVAKLMAAGLDDVKQKYILDVKQTVSAALVLYKAILKKDKQLGGAFAIISDKPLQEMVRKNCIDPILTVVAIVVEEKETKDAKGEQIKLPAEILEAYRKEKQQLQLLRFHISDIEAELAAP